MSVQRRTFLQQSTFGMTALSLFPITSLPDSDSAKPLLEYEDLLAQLIAHNDKGIPLMLSRQLSEDKGEWAGGSMNQYEIPNAHSTASMIMRAAIALSNKDSEYYNNKYLRDALERATACMLRIQYDDGSIDLYSTNFHSTPDTAFIVNDFVPVYKMLKMASLASLNRSIENIYTFLIRAGKCLSVGGIHTANHRWVVSSALACLYSIDKKQKYVDRIDEWLSEGIDQDEDGQYAERSVGVYSPICNHMFTTIGRHLDRSALFDVARKNLDMSMYYIQPGGEVLTEASDRQDKAFEAYVFRYYLQYRYFAIKDNNPQYAAVCQLIENQNLPSVLSLVPDLIADDIYRQKVVEPHPISQDYFKHFKVSGLLRIRRQEKDISVIGKNPTFLVYMNGASVLQSMRLSAAFYGSLGQFVPENMKIEGNRIILSRSVTHGYFQPIPKEYRTGVDGWHEYPRSKREMSEKQTMNYEVVIEENNGVLTIEMSISGTDNVPVSCELNFRAGGLLSGVEVDEMAEDSYFLTSKEARYTVGNDEIVFGPGKVEHRWAQMRGMLPKQNGKSVYLTGYTPFLHKFTIGG